MKLKRNLAIGGLLAGGILAASAPAQAFSFTTNADFSNAPDGNIFLDSIKVDNGPLVTDFSFVNRAEIIANDAVYTGTGAESESEGAASSDLGDSATGTRANDPTEADIVSSLGNNNLNNIVDTEDGQNFSDRRGNFEISVFYESRVSQVYFWERGMNSVLGVQAIDEDGNVIGNFLEIGKSTVNGGYDPGNGYEWDDAGFDIDTQEISGSNQPQSVGSLGLDLSDFGVNTHIAGLKLISEAPKYNGPDFKVVGASVPEPATVAGLLMVGGALVAARRRKQEA